MSAVPLLLAAAVAASAASSQPKRGGPPQVASGRVLKSHATYAPGKGGPMLKDGRLTIVDDAGHVEEFKVSRRTTVRCDGKRADFGQTASPTACGIVDKAYFDARTKELLALELKRGSGEALELRGEVAGTDVMARKVSIRLAAGSTLEFAVAEGVAIEALKIGDLVELRSKDGRSADELHVRPAPAP